MNPASPAPLNRRNLLTASLAATLLPQAQPASAQNEPAEQAPPGLARTATGQNRPPTSEDELRTWLENMVWYHRYTQAEISEVTGLDPQAITQSLAKFEISPDNAPPRGAEAPLLVLPYPGGRHPRIGFLDGAIEPQRETKISIFTPWDPASYVVADIPEALWSNLGLTYLAHTHIPTVWDKQEITLERLEWRRTAEGALDCERKLPHGIAFRPRVVAGRDAVRMSLRLVNGSPQPLSDLRVQNCVMLRGAAGFDQQSNDNKVLQSPYVAVRSERGDRWIITAWDPCQRAWANPPCPCLHSDPQFPDCGPGEVRHLRGWLSFYEGTAIEQEFARIEQTGWRTTRDWVAQIPEA